MSNDSAKGYVILALKNLNYSEVYIEQILNSLSYQFDTVTESEAEKVYLNNNLEE